MPGEMKLDECLCDNYGHECSQLEAYQENIREMLEELESLLHPDESELGLIEISNHIPFTEWQAFKQKYGV